MKFLPYLLLIVTLPCFAALEDHLAEAQQAFRDKDQRKLAREAAYLDGSPVQIYTDYYQFNLALTNDNDSGIASYLSRSENNPVSNRLRSDWLKYLGSRQEWGRFQNEYKSIQEPDNELICYHIQARLQNQDNSALNEARTMWLIGKSQPDSCGEVFNTAIAIGSISQTDIWKRVRLLLENNETTLARSVSNKLAGQFSISGTSFSNVSKSPERYLKQLSSNDLSQLGERTLAAYAIQRLAKDSTAIAAQHWDRIEQSFPDSEQQYIYGWLALEAARDLDISQALRWFQRAGSAALNDEQIAWWARMGLRSKNWPLVNQVIRAMPRNLQEEDTWRYWRAYAMLQTGQKEDAMPIFAKLSREFHFYGQLAQEALPSNQVLKNPSETYKPSEQEVREMSNLPVVQRTIILYRADLRRDAQREWTWFARNLNDKQLLTAAEVAKRYQMYDRAIGAAGLTINLHDFSLRFMAPYRHALQPHIRENDIEEAWVYGLMRQESRFAISARSHVGARGLMQVMPETGAWLAKKMGMSGFTTNMLDDMEINMQLGTFYMRHILEQFDGNPVMATAAYNAGPGRARRWRGDTPLEGAIYAETIPFNETRDYVKKVMSNTAYYAEIFNAPNPPLSKRLGIIPSK